jgi:tellurite resistance-related uncharacterized protein
MNLPPEVRFYRRTDVFTETTVPKGLLKSHSTRPGVWAVIRVLEGRLAYRITDQDRVASEAVLDPATPGLVEPTVQHEVEPLGPVRFYLELHKAPGPPPPPQPRLRRPRPV